jgi:hypothetical protein
MDWKLILITGAPSERLCKKKCITFFPPNGVAETTFQ